MTPAPQESDSGKVSCIDNFLIAALPSNLDQTTIAINESHVLRTLSQNKKLSSVILDFSSVEITDSADLDRLQMMLLAIKLLGRQIVFCGINPGLAGLIVNSCVNLHHDAISLDIGEAIRPTSHD